LTNHQAVFLSHKTDILINLNIDLGVVKWLFDSTLKALKWIRIALKRAATRFSRRQVAARDKEVLKNIDLSAASYRGNSAKAASTRLLFPLQAKMIEPLAQRRPMQTQDARCGRALLPILFERCFEDGGFDQPEKPFVKVA
jgi:hypothetical protein